MMRHSDEQIVPGTAPRKGEQAPVQTMGPHGPAVRYGKMIGFWDPKLGGYSGWKIPSAGEEIRDPVTGNIIFSRGGQDYSELTDLANPKGDQPPKDMVDANAAAKQAGQSTFEYNGKTYKVK